MTRRSVATLAAALVAGSLVTGTPSSPAGAADLGPGGSPPRLGVDLDTVTIPELQTRMARGSLTSSALTAAYLWRIKTLDPTIDAVLRTDPTALRQAAAGDARHR